MEVLIREQRVSFYEILRRSGIKSSPIPPL